jgi:hypothetical protein
MQGENNGFVSVVPQNVKVITVDYIDEANKAIKLLVSKNLKELDVEFDPIADGEYRSVDNNDVLDNVCEDDTDFYYIKTATEPNSTEPVAEIYVQESAVQLTWFIVP